MAIHLVSSLGSGGYFTLPVVVAVVIASVLAFVLYTTMFSLRLDPREPPICHPKIPGIGHILGLIFHSHRYHQEQFDKYKMDICTLPVLGGKLYVINSPDLAQSAIRSRTLSFEPYVTDFIRRLTDVGDAAMKVYKDPAFFSQWLKIVYSSLTGEHLLAVNSAALKVVMSSLNEISTAGVDVPDLFVWARDLITLASTSSLLGSKNPWKSDPRLSAAYWDFEREIMKMMINIFPRFISPTGFAGRALIQKTMTEYFAARHDVEKDVPKFTRDRMELERSYGMKPSDMAGLEVAVLHGALSNTVPTAFWMLVYVFSNPELVELLRVEASAVTKEASSEGQRVVTVNIVRLEDSCPLLFSVLRETQRVISIAGLNRKVMTDTVISDGTRSYLLKEGINLQISHGVTHTLEGVWGPDVGEFDGERFLKYGPSASKPKDATAVKPGAYTPFGAGKHICPGRFFASGEILGFLLPLLLGFEIVGSNGGPIHVPKTSTPWVSTPLPKPVVGSDLSARIRRRVEWEDVVWKVQG